MSNSCSEQHVWTRLPDNGAAELACYPIAPTSIGCVGFGAVVGITLQSLIGHATGCKDADMLLLCKNVAVVQQHSTCCELA